MLRRLHGVDRRTGKPKGERERERERERGGREGGEGEGMSEVTGCRLYFVLFLPRLI